MHWQMKAAGQQNSSTKKVGTSEAKEFTSAVVNAALGHFDLLFCPDPRSRVFEDRSKVIGQIQTIRKAKERLSCLQRYAAISAAQIQTHALATACGTSTSKSRSAKVRWKNALFSSSSSSVATACRCCAFLLVSEAAPRAATHTCTQSRRDVRTLLLLGPTLGPYFTTAAAAFAWMHRLGPSYAQPQSPTYWAAAEQSKLWFKGGPDVDEVRMRSSTSSNRKWLAETLASLPLPSSRLQVEELGSLRLKAHQHTPFCLVSCPCSSSRTPLQRTCASWQQAATMTGCRPHCPPSQASCWQTSSPGMLASRIF